MDSIEKLGQAIKERRVLLGITQEDLAQISGTSLRSLKAMEKGMANPSWQLTTKVLQALGWKLELKELKE